MKNFQLVRTWSDRGLYVAWLVVISIGRDIVPNVSTSRNVVSFGAPSWLTVVTLIYTNIQPTKKLILLLMLNANWNWLLMSHSPPF